jgi:RNA polymerase sigma-70 factor (ECF subfamily)
MAVLGDMAVIIPFKQRGRDPFEELMREHMEQLYRLAYRFCGNRNDAEDLVQELLVKLYPKTEQLLGIEQLRPWLARSLYNLYVDWVRRRVRSPIQGGEEEMAAAMADGSQVSPGADGHVEREQLNLRIQEAMTQLNPDQRTLVSFHDMEGYTLPELEVILETPIGTLKSRLHRARAKLRELLEMEPLDEPERLRE